MPALMTHRIFGERAAAALPEGILGGRDELLAFLIGNQGPDPLFFRVSASPRRSHACHVLARRMHHSRVRGSFSALRRAVAELPGELAGTGRAFALGMLAHYQLDRTAHPFVYAQQRMILDADPTLARQEACVHALIESDLDSWLVWGERRATVLECQPANELALSPECAEAADGLVAAVAREAYGIGLRAGEYSASVRNMQRAYRDIEPVGSAKWRAMGLVERAVRRQSQLMALAHVARRSGECAAANLGRAEWESPFTGERSRASFPDLLDEALGGCPALFAAFLAGRDPGEPRVLGYSGEPLGPGLA